MFDDAGPAIERAVSAIEAYLAQHPAAADSEQGVAQWWLPAVGVDVPVEHVHRALEILWQRGVIERTALPDGGTVYRAARHRT
ncbi:MAG TPA: hypothetical protein VGD42_03245 [Lysobacter sp.]